MSGTRLAAALAISCAATLLPQAAAASERPSLISHVTSPPVREMPAQAFRDGPEEKMLLRPSRGPGSGSVSDPVVQTSTSAAAGAAVLGQWEGLGAGYPGFAVTAVPPDPNLAVGPNHVVQWVNNAFVVFDKSGAPVMSPVSDATFWGSLSTCYQLGGYSDPIVVYDRVADRWLVGEVAIPLFPGLIGQFAQCFAVSTTSDPTGSYYMWAYGFGTTIPDYPKIAAWSDAYYVTWNMFQNASTFSGAEACAWDRNGMVNGAAAPAFVCFQLSSAVASLLPSDPDGTTSPPAGSPNFLMHVDPVANTLNLWRFHVDFATPRNSTLAGPIVVPGTAPFTPACLDTQDCIPQPGSSMLLDALGDRLMYRLAYRNFGDHESLVATHTVVAGGGNTAVRWYEVRNPAGTPILHQQGTFAPDSDHRWMASAAIDQSGNIGVGYSVSGTATFPSLRYTGREAGDPPGVLQDETFVVSGGGAQTGYNRWGDYATMRVDPADDCTFWFTGEYQATTQSANWNTRIASFKFASCGQTQPGPVATITALAASLNPSAFDQPVTFTATVSPSTGTTGSVSFFDGGAPLGSASLNGSGVAAFSTAGLAVGTHAITAEYSGDAGHTGSTSATLSQVVTVAATTTTVTSTPNPSKSGRLVTFTATVSSAKASGSVQFFDGATSLGSVTVSGGSASLATSALTSGKHPITAVYSGDANFSGSTSAVLTQSVTGRK